MERNVRQNHSVASCAARQHPYVQACKPIIPTIPITDSDASEIDIVGDRRRGQCPKTRPDPIV